MNLRTEQSQFAGVKAHPFVGGSRGESILQRMKKKAAVTDNMKCGADGAYDGDWFYFWRQSLWKTSQW